MIKTVCAFVFSAAAAFAQSVVAVDGFHNDESKMPDHYRWDGTRPGGFSEFGKLLRGLGADLRTVRERITREALAGIDVFIIVDPDTPAETGDPKYIEPAEISVIERWVRDGGRLVLLGNDKGNAEFQHFNRLAARFGIEFVETTYPKVVGKGILTITGPHPIFENGLMLYLIEIAPLKVSSDVEVILADKGTPVMALAHVGKGRVFALGDPWAYNEYIDRKDNRRIVTNLFRMLMKK